MAAENKKRVISFADQLQKLEETHGITETDALNVLSKYRSVLDKIVEDETTSFDCDSVSIATPFAMYQLINEDEETRIDSVTGTEYVVPQRWALGISVPDTFLHIANRNVDWSSIPEKDTIDKSKVMVA